MSNSHNPAGRSASNSPGSPPAGDGRLDLVSGPITRTLLLFALPALGSNLLQSVNGSINAMWVGRLLGPSALAATSAASLLLMMLFSTMFGLGMAATMLIGQSAGRRQMDDVRRIVGTSMGLFLIAGFVIAALGWWLTPDMLQAMATPDDVFPLAVSYLRVIFLLVPSVFVFVLLMMALRGVGDAMTPLWFMGLNSVLDMVLNPLLILGVGPFPALGIEGSAIAALLASYTSLLGMLAYIYAKDLVIRLRGAEWRYLVPDLGFLRVIVGKGVMMSLQMLIMSMSGLALLGLVNQSGSTLAAAYGATNQLWTYIQMPAMALAAAVSSMAAMNIGAGQWDRLGAIARSGCGLALLLSSLLALFILVFDRAILGLFLRDPASLDAAAHINHIGIWAMVLLGISMIPGSLVRANGAVLVPLVILVISVFPVRLGFAFGLKPTWGTDAIWWSLIVGSLCSLVLSSAYYRWGRWRSARLLPPAPSGLSQDASPASS